MEISVKTWQINADDNGQGCVAPSAQTVADATYQPLSRPLFIYVNAAAAARPDVEAFIRFVEKTKVQLVQ